MDGKGGILRPVSESLDSRSVVQPAMRIDEMAQLRGVLAPDGTMTRNIRLENRLSSSQKERAREQVSRYHERTHCQRDAHTMTTTTIVPLSREREQSWWLIQQQRQQKQQQQPHSSTSILV
jgi:hypothetical protein